MVVISIVWIYFFCELKYREEFGIVICGRDTLEEVDINVVFQRNIYKLISFCLIPLALLFYFKNSVTPWDYFANTENAAIDTSEMESNSNVKKILKTKVNISRIIFMVIIVYSIFLLILNLLEN